MAVRFVDSPLSTQYAVLSAKVATCDAPRLSHETSNKIIMLSLATMMAPSASAFTVAPSIRPVVASPRVASSPTAMDLPFDIPFSAIAEILDSEGERMYGAVDAPSWVAPVGGIAVIATALLPV